MSRRRVVVGAVAFSALVSGAVLGACGGDDSVAPLGTEDGGSDGTTSSDGSSVDANGGNDSGGTDSGRDTGASDGGLDSSLADDAGNFQDASPGGDAAVLNCGSESCSLPSQTCCLYDQGGSFSGGCANGAGGCPPEVDGGDAGLVSLGCEVIANCSGTGQICCITHDTNDGTTKSACMLEATCATITHQHRAELCDPSTADAGCGITHPGPCSPTNIGSWDLPGGFGTCGGVSAN
jgi:hypothetical protein